MKILLLHNYYRYPGGEETYLRLQRDLLVEHGHDVLLYTKDSATIESTADKINTAVNLLNHTNTHKELTPLIESFKPDIAHFNNIYPHITSGAYDICNVYHVPIVQTIHNYRYFCPKGTLFRDGAVCEDCVLRAFQYPAIQHACYGSSRSASAFFTINRFIENLKNHFGHIDQFVFPSPFTKKYYIEKIPSIGTKSTVISHYVKDYHAASPKKNFFLWVGRMSEEKGIIDLLTVFTKLPQCNLHAIGDGPLFNKAFTYNKYSNISVYHHQSHKQILHQMRKARCVIISSKWFEVLPYVYLESLSTGTPVLTPDTEVFHRTIETRQSYYYQFGNFDNLREKIIEIADIPLGTPNKFYQEFKHHFSEESHYSKLISLYNHLVETKK